MACGTTLHKQTLLAAASVLALLLGGADVAIAQTPPELPAVQVHPPTQRATRPRVAPPRNAAVAPRAAPRPAEPRARTTPPTGMIGNLPPAYAGGQVATGGQVGMLGNRNVMDTPFNQTSYTAQTIQDQQARKLDDVLANDPSVRASVPRGYGFDFVTIRGFDVSSSAYGINGLYGIASGYSFSSLAAIERVEVLKGPGALLNGMPPGGGVGGSINLVTKRAGDVPITQMTNTFASRSQFGTHFDVGRRYGEQSEFGIRFNGAYRNGGTELANQSQELGTAALGLDYRGERVRLSADLGYEKNDIDAMTRFVVLGPSLNGVPTPPDPRQKFVPSWGYWNGEGKFALAQGEVDITENLTAYAQVGAVRGTTQYLYSDIRLDNLNGNFTGTPRLNRQYRDQEGAQAGFRTQVDTGPVHHAINFNVAGNQGEVGILNTTGAVFASNLYNPVQSPVPQLWVGAPPKMSDIHQSSYGIADTMSVLDNRIQFTVGVRQQYVASRSFSTTTGLQTGGYDSSATTPAYALVVKPLENVSLYANYIEGLEAGTVVSDAKYGNVGQVLPPYRTRQYEAGVKVDWGRITTTASWFDITKPFQVEIPAATAKPVLAQGGENQNRGIELNVFGEVTPGVRLLGGVMFINARQAKTQGGTFDGYRSFSIPDTQLNLGGEWDIPFVRGLTWTGRAIYTGGFFADQANTIPVPDWTRFDTGLRYTFIGPWQNKPVVVRFQVDNVFNKSYWAGANTARYLYLGMPRTYLLSTTFNF
jgi:iron complex outermembrane recepter protein